MKLPVLLLCTMMLPSLAVAEIYKWRDTDGSMRYSDVPPPSNVKQESMYGKKIVTPTGLAPLAEVKGDINPDTNKDKAVANKAKVATDKGAEGDKKADKAPLSKEEAAAKRVKDKKAEEENQANLKIKQENCKAAKANLATFINGGRIAKTNEKGEKYYLGDADITQGKADAQRDVDQYCQ